jgi:hypothetical protein
LAARWVHRPRPGFDQRRTSQPVVTQGRPYDFPRPQ